MLNQRLHLSLLPASKLLRLPDALPPASVSSLGRDSPSSDHVSDGPEVSGTVKLALQTPCLLLLETDRLTESNPLLGRSGSSGVVRRVAPVSYPTSLSPTLRRARPRRCCSGPDGCRAGRGDRRWRGRDYSESPVPSSRVLEMTVAHPQRRPKLPLTLMFSSQPFFKVLEQDIPAAPAGSPIDLEERHPASSASEGDARPNESDDDRDDNFDSDRVSAIGQEILIMEEFGRPSGRQETGSQVSRLGDRERGRSASQKLIQLVPLTRPAPSA